MSARVELAPIRVAVAHPGFVDAGGGALVGDELHADLERDDLRELAREADADASTLLRETMVSAKPLGTLAKAGLAAVRHDDAAARALLEDAACAFDAAHMDLHAAIGQVAPDQVEKMVFMTGGAFTGSARQFFEQVPNPTIEKPFDKAALLAIIATFLR